MAEPFRIASVEVLEALTLEERRSRLVAAHHNVALLDAEDVYIDLLTDSGVTAMSSNQWAALHRGDESYVRSRSYHHFLDAVRGLMPFEHILPMHQGRAAERVLAAVLQGSGSIVPSNTHFDTTRANLEAVGIRALDLPVDGEDQEGDGVFGGNLCLQPLSELLRTQAEKVPLVLVTITNNGRRGLPVSLHNLREVRSLCSRYDKPLFLDACRFAENCYFIQKHEPGYSQHSVADIARQIFQLADGVVMSAKKDALANTGGWLGLNDATWAGRAAEVAVMTEGFVTYGGLCGRDLETIAVGLQEGVGDQYLQNRIESLHSFALELTRVGVPVLRPVGGHVVVVDAQACLPHLPRAALPAQTLTAALYEHGGVRACDVSSTKVHGTEGARNQECLVRLALPRRTYTMSHLNQVVDTFSRVLSRRDSLLGFDTVSAASPATAFAAHYLPRVRTSRELDVAARRGNSDAAI